MGWRFLYIFLPLTRDIPSGAVVSGSIMQREDIFNTYMRAIPDVTSPGVIRSP